MEESFDISIIIPTYERKEIFDHTLSAAYEASRHLFTEIIVVNDSKKTQPVVPEGMSKVTVLNNAKSGAASARNLGASKARGRLLLFLDNDIVITRSTLDHIIAQHQGEKRVAFNPNWIYPPELIAKLPSSSFGRFLLKYNYGTYSGWYNDPLWQDNSVFQSPAIASFHLSILREHFNEAGGYNEQFPFSGFEDYDLPVRLSNARVEQYIDSRVTVWHNETDRLNFDNWMKNWENRSVSRKIGVLLGHHALTIEYSPGKRFILSCILLLYPVLSLIRRLWPNSRFMDPGYFRLCAVMQAAVIYKGYRSRTHLEKS